MDKQQRLNGLVERWQRAQAEGLSLSPEGLCAECPDLLAELRARLAAEGGTVSYVADQEDLPTVRRAPDATDPAATVLAPAGSLDAAALRNAPPGYRITGELGRGGMGIVYQAEQLSLKRAVALKVLRAGDDAHADQLARFRAEAEAVAQLQHANIVQVHEIGEHDGRPFISLEFIAGGTLRQRLQRRPFTPDEAAQLLITLARAMQHAHQRGVIHRDLKPGNVLLTEDGTPKISDFGLAKRLECGDMGRTRFGSVLGTPSYMAPEQADGQIEQVGPLADVYALGALFYELLTGQPPFRGATLLETLEQVRTREPAAPSRLKPRVPRDLETICLKALAKDPGQRYSSALALAQDLERYLAGEPILARRDGWLRRGWRVLRRRRIAALSLLLAFLAVGVATYALRDSLLTQRRARLIELLRRDDWSAATRPELDHLLVDIEAIDSSHAADARQEIQERLEKVIVGQYSKLRLDPDDLERIEGLLSWLQEIDPPRFVRQRTAFDNRRRTWQPLVALETRERAFPPGVVRTADESLVHDRKAVKGHAAVVPTAISCPRTAAYEALFDDSWQKGREIGLLLNYEAGHPGPVRHLAFSPDGKQLVSCSDEHPPHLWDLHPGHAPVPFGNSAVRRALFAPDGKTLATSGGTGVELWDPATGQLLHRLVPSGG